MAGKVQQQQRSDNEEEVIDGEAEVEAGEGEEGEEGAADRGDNAEPEVTLKNLKKVAGAGDEEGDGEEEVDGEAEAEGEAEGGKKGGPPKTIPYGRFSKEVAKNADLAAENERLRKAAGVTEEAEEAADEEEVEQFDHDAKEKEYLVAVSQGDFDTATALRKEINAQLKAEAKAEASADAIQIVGRAEQQKNFTSAVNDTLKKYPWLDDKGDEADEEAIESVVALRNHYIHTQGLAPAEALRKAADKVAKGRTAAESAEEEGEEGEGAEKLSPEQKRVRAEKERKREATRKGVDAQGKQPPALKGKGDRGHEGGTGKAVEDMTDEEFDKLSEADKKKARGDE